MKNLKFNQLVFLMLLFVASFQAKAGEELEEGQETGISIEDIGEVSLDSLFGEDSQRTVQSSLEDQANSILDSLPADVKNDNNALIELAESIGGQLGLTILTEWRNRKLSIYYNSHFERAINRLVEPLAHRVLFSIFSDKTLDQLIQYRDPLVRTFVAEIAGEIGGERSLDILEKLVQDKSELVRVTVAQSAGEIGGERSLDILEKLVQDKSVSVQTVVVKSAEEIGGERGLAILVELLETAKHANYGSDSMLAILRTINNDENLDLNRDILSAIIEQIQHQSPGSIPLAYQKILREVGQLAEEIGGEHGLAILTQIVQNTRIYRLKIEAVVKSAKLMEKGQALIFLIEFLTNMEPRKRSLFGEDIFIEIQKISNNSVVLRELAEHEDLKNKMYVIFKLAEPDSRVQLKEEESLAILKKLALDKNPIVREEVARTVAKFKVEGGGLYTFLSNWMFSWAEERDAILMELSQDTVPSVRVTVAQAAEEIGGESGLAILRELVTQTEINTDVREAITVALVEIGGDEAAEIIVELSSK